MTAKMIYVLYPIEENAGGVTMTTIKLKTQLADVDTALAGARILKGTISAGYSQVMPSQPIAKKVLKTKRKTVLPIPAFGPLMLAVIAKTTMDSDIPAAPNSIRERRPNLSIVKTAIQEARKYSVPLAPAMIRESSPERPTWPSSTVGM